MKKILLVLLVISSFIIPVKETSAKSYSFNNYYCDAKQPVGDGTFLMTCHIVAYTDFEVNHIEGDLILRNVKLESIKTNGDWTSHNGLSSNFKFTSSSSHQGTFTVADLLFSGNLSDTECEASIAPTIIEKDKPVEEDEINKVCAIVDNEYYGANGTKVTVEKYYEECCNYVCTVVDNKYYFNSAGKSVSYDAFIEDCSETTIIPDTPQTGIDYGYILLPLGIISIIAIIKLTKKNTKIYKI